MYGNLKGWIISGVMFLIAAVMLFAFARVPSVSPPTGKYKLADQLALPTDPKQFLPSMTASCNAAERYREAIAEYNENKDAFGPRGKFASSGAALVDANPKAIQNIVEAASCSGFDLYKSKPDAVVTYRNNFPDLEALTALGKMTIKAGATYSGRKDAKKAEEYLKAAFVLGYRLYNERVVLSEMNAGLDLMLTAVTNLGVLYKNDAGKAQACTDFVASVNEFSKAKIIPLQNAVTTISSKMVGTYGGDIHALAKACPEKMWRVEAIMSLGRMKFNTTKRGDQVWAKRYLKQYRDDPDPAVKLAAQLADELTIDKYNLLGG